MLCKGCGKTFPDEYAYCPHCGTGKHLTVIAEKNHSDHSRLAELAISERVFKRTLTWLGILASPFIVAFGILGYQFQGLLHTSKDQIDTRTKAALTEIAKSEEYSRSTVNTSKAVQRDLDDARQVVSQVRSLRADVNSLQSQVEGFYKTQIRELFGGNQSKDRYSGTAGNWTVTLKKEPIPGSLRVRCGAIELYSENYVVTSNKVTVKNCGFDLKAVAQNPDDQDFIEVFYHPRN